MKFEVWAKTDVGLKREINQDSVLIDHDLNLFIVADGMGGHKGGEVASAMAVDIVQSHLKEEGFKKHSRLRPAQILVEAYRKANAQIYYKSTTESPELMGMGTTMVGVWVYQGIAHIANVGDSRAYLYRKPYLWQLTEDHSLINEQVRAGVIAEEDAPHVLGKNVITRSVGFEAEVVVDVLEREVQPQDAFLLCSDGLSSLVGYDKILEILNKNSLQRSVPAAISAAKEAGGDDNVSVIVIRPQGS